MCVCVCVELTCQSSMTGIGVFHSVFVRKLMAQVADWLFNPRLVVTFFVILIKYMGHILMCL